MAEDQMLLRDPDILPSAEVLEKNLGKVIFDVYQILMTEISKKELNAEWNYYRDGKAWFCKVINKKKTVFWLSIWDGYFRIGFYFTAKNCSAVGELDIDNGIKEKFTQAKSIGKLLPLILDIRKKEQLSDLLKIIDCKKSLK